MNTLPPWYLEAGRLMGVTEIPGAKSNATIVGWAKKIGGWVANVFKNDDTAWCALFVAHCMGAANLKDPLPANPLGALQWAKYGRSLLQPSVGAIMVFNRVGAPGAGHVGFYVAEAPDAYLIRGGNQGNKVSEAWIAKSRLVAVRWPCAYLSPAGGPLRLASRSANLSKTEA